MQEIYVTKKEYDVEIQKLYNKIDSSYNAIYKSAVDTYGDIELSYPNPKTYWTVKVHDQDTLYQFNGEEWIDLEIKSLPENLAKQEDIENLKNEIIGKEQKYASSILTDKGAIRKSDGSFSSAFPDWMSSDFVKISPDYEIKVKSSIAGSVGYAFFNSEKEFISSASFSGIDIEDKISIPKDAAYIRVCCKSVDLDKFFLNIKSGGKLFLYAKKTELATLKNDLDDELTELKYYVDNITNNSADIIKYDSSILTDKGAIRKSDGSLSTAFPDWMSSDFVKISADYEIKVKSSIAGSVGYAFYDDQKNFIGSASFSGIDIEDKISIPKDAAYIRVCCKSVDLNKFNLVVYNNSSSDFVTRSEFEEVKKDVEDLKKGNSETDIEFDSSILTIQGGIKLTDGTVYSQLNTWKCSDYLSVENFNTIEALGTKAGSVGLAFFNSKKEFISSKAYTGEGIDKINIPSSAEYVRFSDAINNFSDFNAKFKKLSSSDLHLPLQIWSDSMAGAGDIGNKLSKLLNTDVSVFSYGGKTSAEVAWNFFNNGSRNDDYAQIIWCCTNDEITNSLQTQSSGIDHSFNNIQKIIKNIKHNKWLVIGMLWGYGTSEGHPKLGEIKKLNQRFKDAYGAHYLDLPAAVINAYNFGDIFLEGSFIQPNPSNEVKVSVTDSIFLKKYNIVDATASFAPKNLNRILIGTKTLFDEYEIVYPYVYDPTTSAYVPDPNDVDDQRTITLRLIAANRIEPGKTVENIKITDVIYNKLMVFQKLDLFCTESSRTPSTFRKDSVHVGDWGGTFVAEKIAAAIQIVI